LTEEIVYLSLGSNLGDREHNLDTAVQALGSIFSGIRRSSIYETRPMYVVDQPEFLNMVVSGRCALQPSELLRRILVLELRMGRDRSSYTPKGPRIIDIDILLFGRRIVAERDLEIPHPRLRERQFVLIPLLQLEPELEDPQTRRPLAESLRSLEDQGVYIFKA
jgi:2-amino-4-hydroxy-6-hydroxymethyldihydropteridine diphosphokinase